MRKSRESAEITEKAIREIRRGVKITDSLITRTCQKHEINEKHIRRVGNFEKDLRENNYKLD
jgi:hypothetical protein